MPRILYAARVEQFPDYRPPLATGKSAMRWHCCEAWAPRPEDGKTYLIRDEYDPRDAEIRCGYDPRLQQKGTTSERSSATGLVTPTYTAFQAAITNKWKPCSFHDRALYNDPLPSSGERVAASFESHEKFPTGGVSAQAKLQGRRREADFIKEQAATITKSPFVDVRQMESETERLKRASKQRWSRRDDDARREVLKPAAWLDAPQPSRPAPSTPTKHRGAPASASSMAAKTDHLSAVGHVASPITEETQEDVVMDALAPDGGAAAAVTVEPGASLAAAPTAQGPPPPDRDLSLKV